jgi:hypothetical protein
MPVTDVTHDTDTLTPVITADGRAHDFMSWLHPSPAVGCKLS